MNANEPNNKVSDEVISAEAELLAAQEALEAARLRLAELKAGVPDDGQIPEAESVEAPFIEGEVVEVAAVVVEDTAPEGESVVLGAVAACAVSGQTDIEAEIPTEKAAQQEASPEPIDPTPAPPSGQPVPEWVPYSTAPKAAPSPVEPVSVPQPNSAAANGDYYSYQQPSQPAQPPYSGYAAPGYNQASHAGPGAVPPQQPYYGYQYQQPYYQQPYPTVVSSKDHVAAGLLAIFLGQLGIHKFYLGYNTAGFIMLAVTIIGSIFTFGLAAGVMWIIAIIEGILYLTKSQSEFEQTYVINKREWF